MVKFFLKSEKHPPKSQPFSKNKEASKSKPNKVLDYRIVIWKKLFSLIKIQHSIMLQKFIRKIKQAKLKLQLKQKKEEKTVENQVKKSQLQKKITLLDTKYKSIKSLKKHQLKKITLYIILQVLKIENIDKILSKAQLEKTFETKEFKQQLQGNDSVKKFIEKLNLLTVYQKELEVCGQLVDLVQEKKIERKTKLKERRERKFQREQTEKEQNTEQAGDAEQDSNDEKVLKEQNYIKPTVQSVEKKNRTQKYPQQSLNNKEQTQRKPLHKQYQNPNSLNKQKFIHKQRTQFRKTGRNKVKHQKEQKKLHFKHKAQEQQASSQNYFNNKAQQQSIYPDQKLTKYRGRFSFSKEQAHPSWKAKQQLKQEVFIQPFQGKKILL